MNLRACTGSCSRGPIQLSMVGESHYPISDYNNRLNIKGIGARFKGTKNDREKFWRLWLSRFQIWNNFRIMEVDITLLVVHVIRVDEFPYGRIKFQTVHSWHVLPAPSKNATITSHTTSSSKAISYYRHDTFFVAPSLAVGPLAQQYAFPPDLEIVIQKTRRLYFLHAEVLCIW